MKVVKSVQEMKDLITSVKSEGKKLSFVPTMGYLHEGHLSLMKKGREVGEVLIVSIFVNPIQFGVNEDLGSYPRDMERDRRLCETEGVDVVFAPTAEEIYPEGYQTYVDVEGVTKKLCGAVRPGHFRGVATVVAKLFNIVRPDYAIFGEKDFQQLVTIRRLVRDLGMDVAVIGMPIVRENGGLAMSSRNSYLDERERMAAGGIYRALSSAKEVFDGGERSARIILTETKRVLEIEPLIQPEYVKLVDMETLEDIERVDGSALLAVAVKIGRTRLIDNILLRKV